MINFELKEEYIELFKLLKIVRVAQTGGHAKLLIENGEVELNGLTEYRKRAKIRKGDKISCEGQLIEVR